MALEVYYKRDIENALRAAEHATRKILPRVEPGEYRQGYKQGFNAALASIALAFGLYVDQEKDVIER
jgi:hypothetical protein